MDSRICVELRTNRDIACYHQPCNPNEKRQNFMLAPTQPRSLFVALSDLRKNPHSTTVADSTGFEMEFVLKVDHKEDDSRSKNVNQYCPVSGKLLDARSPVSVYRGCTVGFASSRIRDEFERKDGHPTACAYLDVLIKERLGELPGLGRSEKPPELLVQGADFIKHAVGRGAPASRRVFIQDHDVCWKKPNVTQKSGIKRIPVDSITGVKAGKQTPVFSKKASRSAPADCCFSLLSSARSLDLQAPSMAVRDQWVAALTGWLQSRQAPAAVTTIHLPPTSPVSQGVASSKNSNNMTNVVVAGLGLKLPHENVLNPGIIVFRSEGKTSEKLESLECLHRSTLTLATQCPEFGVQLVNPPPRFIRICVYHAASAQAWEQSLHEVLQSKQVTPIGSVIVDVPTMIRNAGIRLPFIGQELDPKKGIGGLLGSGLMLTVDENKEDMTLQEAIDMLLAGEPVTSYTAQVDLERFPEGAGLKGHLPVEQLKLRLIPQGNEAGNNGVSGPETMIGSLVLERTQAHGPGDVKVLSLESISDMYEGPQTNVFAAHFDKELLPRSVRACAFSIDSLPMHVSWNLEAKNGRVRDGIIQAIYTLMTDGWPGLSSPLGAVVTTDLPPQVNENWAREDSESAVPEVRDWTMAADLSKNGAIMSFGDPYDYETDLSTTGSVAYPPNMHFDVDSRTAKYEFSSEAKSQSQVSSGLFEKFEVRGAPRNGMHRFSVSHTGGISIIRGASLSRQQPSISRPRHSTSSRASLSTASLISVVSQVGGGTRQSTLQDYLDSASKKKRVEREVGSVNSMSRDRWSKRAVSAVKPVEEKTVHAEMDSDPAIQSLFFELGSINKSSVDMANEAGRRASTKPPGSANNTLTRAAAAEFALANGRPTSNPPSRPPPSTGGGSSSSSSSSSSSGSVARGSSSVPRTTAAVSRTNPPQATRGTPSQPPNEFSNLLSLQNDIQDLKRMIQSRVPAQ